MRGESEAPPPRSALSGGEPPPTQRGGHQPTPMGSIDTKKGHLSRPSDVPIKYRSGKLRVIRTHGNDFGWGGPCLSPIPKIMGKHSLAHPVGPKFEEQFSVSTLNKSVSTRPSVMEVSPKTFGLSKSILPIDRRIAGYHGISGDYRMAGIIK